MDKEISDLLQNVKDANRPQYWQLTPEVARTNPMLISRLFGQPPIIERVENFEIASSGYNLPVRLYLPSRDVNGLIVYLHGGGWVVGSVAEYGPLTATIAQRTGYAVLSVDYRLAPEHPYPVPLQDARAALSWAASDGATKIGGPLRRLVAMGDSVGANLATVASRLHNHDNNRQKVDFQVLAYPVTAADFDTSSYVEFADGKILTRNDMKWFWNQYLPDASRRSDPEAAPLLTRDLSASPPAFVLTAEFDPLRDEGEAYAERLKQDGVACEMVRCKGLPHGFLAMINYAPSASSVFDLVVSAIRSA